MSDMQRVMSWDEAQRAAASAVMPTVEPADALDAEMVLLRASEARWRIDMKYAGRDNFAEVAMYDAACAVLREPVKSALLDAQHRLERKGFGLVVWDAYRPWSVTWMMWHTAKPEHRRTFVADPARGSVHNRGGAVDVGLYHLQDGAEVPMPGAFDEFSERSASDYAGGTAEQRSNRDTLIAAMGQAGFTVDRAEWWHFNAREGRRYRLCNTPLSAWVSGPERTR